MSDDKPTPPERPWAKQMRSAADILVAMKRQATEQNGEIVRLRCALAQACLELGIYRTALQAIDDSDCDACGRVARDALEQFMTWRGETDE